MTLFGSWALCCAILEDTSATPSSSVVPWLHEPSCSGSRSWSYPLLPPARNAVSDGKHSVITFINRTFTGLPLAKCLRVGIAILGTWTGFSLEDLRRFLLSCQVIYLPIFPAYILFRITEQKFSVGLPKEILWLFKSVAACSHQIATASAKEVKIINSNLYKRKFLIKLTAWAPKLHTNTKQISEALVCLRMPKKVAWLVLIGRGVHAMEIFQGKR